MILINHGYIEEYNRRMYLEENPGIESLFKSFEPKQQKEVNNESRTRRSFKKSAT